MTTEEKLQIIEEFSTLPTGNISDAMDELGMKRSFIRGLQQISGQGRTAAGFALTIQQMQKNVSAGAENLGRHGKVIDEQVQPGDLIVIDTNEFKNASTGGSIHLMIAKANGATGYLTNGCVRDVEEIRVVDLPVCCGGTCPAKSAFDLETVGINTPVSIGGVQIRAGDFVAMDSTGVLVIPIERLREVLEGAKKIKKREDRMMELLRAGYSLTEARELAKK